MPGGFSDLAALVGYLFIGAIAALALWLIGVPAWLAWIAQPASVWLWLRAVRD